jgi:thiosulfate reductase cytochrome b subunit
MKQSRLMSLVESIANVAAGFGLALATQLIVFPWFGIAASLAEHLAIGAAFTVVSILRSYLLRRLFEHWRLGRSGGASAPMRS